MAKLSRKQGLRVSFLLAQMTLADDQRQREEILRELLESLGIDAEQAQESRESAARHLRYMASRKRKSERAAKPVDTGETDIYRMSHEQLHQHNKELFAKLKRLLEDRRAEQDAQRPDIEAMSDEERQAYQQHLMRSIAAKLELTPSTPDPAPIVEDAPTLALPTEKMRKAIARFDDLTDADQVDQLSSLWGRA